MRPHVRNQRAAAIYAMQTAAFKQFNLCRYDAAGGRRVRENRCEAAATGASQLRN